VKNSDLCSSDSGWEQQKILEKLRLLLAEQTRRYLSGTSTSIAVDTARELFQSLLYTLRLVFKETGRPLSSIASEDLPTLLRQGQRLLREKVQNARLLWRQACLTSSSINHLYYHETLEEIRQFFRRYDLYYFAHQIPCSIDYPLCVPVSEDEPGISYIERWLQKIILENQMLRCFPSENVKRLLIRINPDYQDEPLNLCEPPLVNAIGLALLGRPAFALEIQPEDCHQIEEICRHTDDLGALLKKTAETVALQLAPDIPDAPPFLCEVAQMLRPRLETVRFSGDLTGMFL
jgi:hypothetical protein